MADENLIQSNEERENVARVENLSVINAMMMRWSMGVRWIPKYDGDQSKLSFSEWYGQVQAMLTAQGLNEEQKIDFIWGP